MQYFLRRSTTSFFFLSTLLAFGGFSISNCSKTKKEISFNEHIRPILNEKCVQCHGGVKKQAGLSLLFRQEALAELESGKRAIVPGKPEQSELIQRIQHEDPELRMPTNAAALSEEEIALFQQWIKAGAEWEPHWAYLPPLMPKIPASSSWVRNSIDAFVLDKLKEKELTPSTEAAPATLVRRLSLDLTGLPPNPELADAFLKNPSDQAYEHLVDQLLDSPHYGERWAALWLDLARYADSKGFEKDHHREIWLYRDWLIKAFNADMPFNQFTIEQLAGDLLENPTSDQYIATGFHRNTMNNNEGGVQNEEYRMAAVMDRISTTWDVWHGTSFACAQCHDHPYDPFSQEEYYQYMDFFNNTKDEDTGDDAPNLRLYETGEEENIEAIKAWIKKLNNVPQQEEWAAEIDKVLRITEPKVWSYTAKSITKTAKNGDDYLLEGRHGGIAVFEQFPLFNTTKFLVRYSSAIADGQIIIHLDSINGPEIGKWKLGDPGWKLDFFNLKAVSGKHDIYLRFDSPTAAKRTNDRVGHLLWIIPQKAFSVFEQAGGETKQKEFLRILESEGKKSPILMENPASFTRKTFALDRGSWLSPTHEVFRKTPSSMPPFEENYPNNRLGLAQWMVNGKHPLTSRVFVNRVWEQLFGAGIVFTLEDFGTQGEAPSHPKLLDYLALQFQEQHQWSLKQLLKEIVLSATYRQSSDAAPDLIEQDPYNRLLARGPRFRLSAEQIRDQALAISGLLSSKMYGPSVMPFLPEGAWNVVYQQYTSVQWQLSEGEDQYRRGLYTYWKRTSPYPSMLTFDSQSREVCVSRRIRTNTPLQALVLLNDPVFIEAANALGRLMEAAGQGDLEKAITYGYKRALIEAPDSETVALLTTLHQDALTVNEQLPQANFITNTSIRQQELEGPMAVVAHAILNLDALLVKN